MHEAHHRAFIDKSLFITSYELMVTVERKSAKIGRLSQIIEYMYLQVGRTTDHRSKKKMAAVIPPSPPPDAAFPQSFLLYTLIRLIKNGEKAVRTQILSYHHHVSSRHL